MSKHDTQALLKLLRTTQCPPDHIYTEREIIGGLFDSFCGQVN